MANAKHLEAGSHAYVFQTADRVADVFFPCHIPVVDIDTDTQELMRYDASTVVGNFWARSPELTPLAKSDILFRQLDLTASHLPVDYPIYIAGQRRLIEQLQRVGAQKRLFHGDGWNINFQHSGGFYRSTWTVAHIASDGWFDAIGLSRKPNQIEDAWGSIQEMSSDYGERYATFFIGMTAFTYNALLDADIPLAGVFVTPYEKQ